jgi:pyruvate carboxylase subunit B
MPRYYVQIRGREVGLDVQRSAGETVIRPVSDEGDSEPVHVDFAPVHSNPQTGEGLYSLIADGRSFQVHVERTDEGLRMIMWRNRYDVAVLTEREWRLQKVAPRQAQAGGQVTVKSPMPGLVKSVAVTEGDEVQSGQRLVVLEAMKMENEIGAPSGGRVTAVHVSAGSTVDGGKPLITLE